jgi:uncharacterized membrane protein
LKNDLLSSTLVNIKTKKLRVRLHAKAWRVLHNFNPAMKSLTFAAKNLEVFNQFTNSVFGEQHFLCSPYDARRF